MASRITQETRPAIVATGGSAGGGSARITQITRATAINEGTLRGGGSARITQVTRVVICTTPLAGGGLPLMGVGS